MGQQRPSLAMTRRNAIMPLDAREATDVSSDCYFVRQTNS